MGSTETTSTVKRRPRFKSQPKSKTKKGPQKFQHTRVACYCLIFDSEKRILLCRLNIGEQSEGSWTLPGGGIDFGEIPQEAAIREVYEETGLNVEIDRIVDAHSELFVHPEREMHAVRMVFLANVTSGEIRFEENGSTDRCQFVTLEEAESMQCVGLVRRCIRLIRCTDLLSLNP